MESESNSSNAIKIYSILSYINVYCVINRFTLFRLALNAEMKDVTREGLHVKNKKTEKELVTKEEEELFWNLNVLGMSTAKSLLNTVYFYNANCLSIFARLILMLVVISKN